MSNSTKSKTSSKATKTKTATKTKSTSSSSKAKTAKVVAAPTPALSDVAVTSVGAIVTDDKAKAASKKQRESKVLTFESYKIPPFDPKAIDPSKALAQFGLDWGVEKRPMFFPKEGGAYQGVNGRYVVVRKDTDQPLGVVTSKYQVSQNNELLNSILPLVDSGAEIVFGGTMGGGSLVYFMMKTNISMEIKGDEIVPYLFVGTSHDGSKKIHFGLSTVRMFCQNMFESMMARSTMRVSHIGDMSGKLNDVSQVLKAYAESTKNFKAQLEAMTRVKFGQKEFEELARFIFRVENDRELTAVSGKKSNLITGLSKAIEMEADSHKSTAGTLYNAWNGVTAFFNHGKKRTETERIENSLVGSGAFEMNRAFAHVIDKYKIGLN